MPTVPDLSSAIFLGCFLFGLGFSAISFLAGGLRGRSLGSHSGQTGPIGHSPHGGGPGLHLGAHHSTISSTGPAPHVHGHGFKLHLPGHGHGLPAASHAPGPPGSVRVHSPSGHQVHGDAGDHGASTSANGAPFGVVNAMSVTAFLTWFGAGGYVTRALAHQPLVLALLVAVLAGFGGGWIVYLFLFKFLLRGQTTMRPDDYRLEGTLARVSVPISAGGVGEIVFTKVGTRRCEGARSLDQVPLARETEVVIVGYEKGIALVQDSADFFGTSLGPPMMRP
ncbi:MAG: hypothetical protein HY329_19570 [Chloroflexi bacterium]|nr:hypothetical protein [Chloroflexota bacterium]